MADPHTQTGTWPPAPPAYLPPVAPRRRSTAVVVAFVLLVLTVVGSATALVASGVLDEVRTDPEVVAYREDARTALREFQTLDDELDDGLRYIEYEILVQRAKDALDDLQVRMPARFSGDASYPALSRALDSYQAAEEAWRANIDCTFCDQDEVEPTLQHHWSDASIEVGKAGSALEAT